LKSLGNLRELHLDNNQLTTLESQCFDGVKSIQIINLYNNFLTFEDEYLPIDDSVTIRIRVASRFQSLVNLERLNLRNNSIAAVFEDFTLTSLTELDLSHNRISIVATDELQFPNKDKLTIDLRFNQIEMIDFRKPENNQSAVTLLVDNNPLDCDCRILHFLNYLKESNQNGKSKSIDVIADDLICAKPERFANKTVRSLDAMDLICPLDTEGSNAVKRCPTECSCNVRPADKALLLDCSNDVLTQVPHLPIASHLNLHKTELRIENSNLTELPTGAINGYSSVTELRVGHNQLSDLRLEQLPPNLIILELNDNRLQRINESVLAHLNNSKTLKQMRLAGNDWQCDCNNWQFINFAQNFYSKISDFAELKCADGTEISKLIAGDVCTENETKIMLLSIVIAVLGLLIGALAALYYKYQKQIKMWMYAHNCCMWFVTEEELDKDKKYDAFVSYSHKDEDFVADYLVPALENGIIPYKLCLHERDWSPGLEISSKFLWLCLLCGPF